MQLVGSVHTERILGEKMDSGLIQSDKKRNSRWCKVGKYILTTENLICLAGFWLSVGGYYFTDFEAFRFMNLVLAFLFVVYAVCSNGIRISRSIGKKDFLKSMFLPLVILLIMVDSLYFVSVAKIAYAIKKICTLGILSVLDGCLLMFAIKNRRLKKEKMEFTVKRGLLIGIRYLVGVYQLVFSVLILVMRVFSFLDPNTGLFPDDYNHGLAFFVISPLVLYSFAYICFCKYFFKESKDRNLCIMVTLLPLLLVMAMVITDDSFNSFRRLYKNGSTGAMLYLYAARDLILLLFTTMGMIVAVFRKRIPAIRLMLGFYALIYLLTVYSLPEYWIMKDVVSQIQKGRIDISTERIVHASADATPALIVLLDETEWQECLEYLELKKQGKGPVCTTCTLHYKYEWMNQQYQRDGDYNFSRARSIKMIEKKLQEVQGNTY